MNAAGGADSLPVDAELSYAQSFVLRLRARAAATRAAGVAADAALRRTQGGSSAAGTGAPGAGSQRSGDRAGSSAAGNNPDRSAWVELLCSPSDVRAHHDACVLSLLEFLDSRVFRLSVPSFQRLYGWKAVSADKTSVIIRLLEDVLVSMGLPDKDKFFTLGSVVLMSTERELHATSHSGTQPLLGDVVDGQQRIITLTGAVYGVISACIVHCLQEHECDEGTRDDLWALVNSLQRRFVYFEDNRAQPDRGQNFVTPQARSANAREEPQDKLYREVVLKLYGPGGARHLRNMLQAMSPRTDVFSQNVREVYNWFAAYAGCSVLSGEEAPAARPLSSAFGPLASTSPLYRLYAFMDFLDKRVSIIPNVLNGNTLLTYRIFIALNSDKGLRVSDVEYFRASVYYRAISSGTRQHLPDCFSWARSDNLDKLDFCRVLGAMRYVALADAAGGDARVGDLAKTSTPSFELLYNFFLGDAADRDGADAYAWLDHENRTHVGPTKQTVATDAPGFATHLQRWCTSALELAALEDAEHGNAAVRSSCGILRAYEAKLHVDTEPVLSYLILAIAYLLGPKTPQFRDALVELERLVLFLLMQTGESGGARATMLPIRLKRFAKVAAAIRLRDPDRALNTAQWMSQSVLHLSVDGAEADAAAQQVGATCMLRSLLEEELYTPGRKHIGLLCLAAAEATLRGGSALDVLASASRMEIEHVLAQQADIKLAALYPGWTQVLKDFVLHRLGNLSILPKSVNIACKDKPWQDKVEVLRKKGQADCLRLTNTQLVNFSAAWGPVTGFLCWHVFLAGTLATRWGFHTARARGESPLCVALRAFIQRNALPFEPADFREAASKLLPSFGNIGFLRELEQALQDPPVPEPARGRQQSMSEIFRARAPARGQAPAALPKAATVGALGAGAAPVLLPTVEPSEDAAPAPADAMEDEAAEAAAVFETAAAATVVAAAAQAPPARAASISLTGVAVDVLKEMMRLAGVKQLTKGQPKADGSTFRLALEARVAAARLRDLHARACAALAIADAAPAAAAPAPAPAGAVVAARAAAAARASAPVAPPAAAAAASAAPLPRGTDRKKRRLAARADDDAAAADSDAAAGPSVFDFPDSQDASQLTSLPSFKRRRAGDARPLAAAAAAGPARVARRAGQAGSAPSAGTHAAAAGGSPDPFPPARMLQVLSWGKGSSCCLSASGVHNHEGYSAVRGYPFGRPQQMYRVFINEPGDEAFTVQEDKPDGKRWSGKTSTSAAQQAVDDYIARHRVASGTKVSGPVFFGIDAAQHTDNHATLRRRCRG